MNYAHILALSVAVDALERPQTPLSPAITEQVVDCLREIAAELQTEEADETDSLGQPWPRLVTTDGGRV